MRKTAYHLLLLFIVLTSTDAFSQGVGIPSKRGGIGFGNLSKFIGIRFNFKDKKVEKITGINTTIWMSKDDSEQTGVVNGISLGLPMAIGHDDQNGISVGIVGVGATKNLRGINVGLIGAGAGQNIVGLNIGGIGIGSGEDLKGITIGGIGAGAGGNVTGINIGGVGIAAGKNLSGFNFGGVGVGSGGSVRGISIGGVGIGASENVSGLQVSLGGIGAGHKVTGITFGGLGVGAGEEVKGITAAVVGIGGPKVTGLAVALAVGGVDVRGVMIAPAFFTAGDVGHHTDDGTVVSEGGGMTGLSISAYNRIKGDQKGVAIGIVNYTKRIKGFQLGLINIVRDNPRGLRVLPIFNTRFKKGN